MINPAPSINALASLKLVGISRLLAGEQKHSESWKVIPKCIFGKYGGLSFILRCNYDKKFLEQIEIPLFYKSILQYFGN